MQVFGQSWGRMTEVSGVGGSPTPWASEAGEELRGAMPCPVCPLTRLAKGFLWTLVRAPGRCQVDLTRWPLLTYSPPGMAWILEGAPEIAVSPQGTAGTFPFLVPSPWLPGTCILEHTAGTPGTLLALWG